MPRCLFVAVVSLMLAACGSNGTPGAMSGSEAQQLNDAAMMLDANSVDANAATVIDDNQGDPQ